MSDVKISQELFAPVSGGVELCYQTFGDPTNEPLLLVMGLGGPMIWWDTGFCEMLARQGFYVIRYDNRDTGKSSSQPGKVSRSELVRSFVTGRGRVPYTLADMAMDGVGLLDHLDVEGAHVAGISMGGMIVQTMALERPQRVRSMTSIMSTTGQRSVGWQDPKLIPRLLAGRPIEKESYVKTSVAFSQVIGSPGYPEPVERAIQRSEDTFDRGLNPDGVLRHMLAIVTQPNRSKPLNSLTIPSQVIHGLGDRMVHVSGGRATAAAIPGSELLLVDGMGHDLPVELWDSVTASIRRTADRGSA